jgi:hypothetical protein
MAEWLRREAANFMGSPAQVYLSFNFHLKCILISNRFESCCRRRFFALQGHALGCLVRTATALHNFCKFTNVKSRCVLVVDAGPWLLGRQLKIIGLGTAAFSAIERRRDLSLHGVWCFKCVGDV